MASWEQALKQRFCTLLGPDAPHNHGKGKYWDPFSTCTTRVDAFRSDVKGMPPQELAPACLPEREWDPTRKDLDEVAIPVAPAIVSQQSGCVVDVNVKLPPMFFNKEWDLSPNMAIPAAVAVALPTPDESLVHSRQRHCSFLLQQCDRFGMVLDETPEPLPGGLLVVTRLDACSAFARTAQGACGLMTGDVIVEVNGLHGSAAELCEVLRREFSVSGRKTIDLVVRARPPTFNIEVRREGAHWQKLGISADGDQSNPGCLLVQGLRAEGLIPSWNTAHGSLCICKGDLVTHVNAVSMDAAAMKKEVQRCSAQGSRLRFRIVTPAGQVAGCQKEVQEDKEDSSWPETTVPWDMQVRWLDDMYDGMSEVSTACGSSAPSGTRTPEDSCPSGARTPEER